MDLRKRLEKNLEASEPIQARIHPDAPIGEGTAMELAKFSWSVQLDPLEAECLLRELDMLEWDGTIPSLEESPDWERFQIALNFVLQELTRLRDFLYETSLPDLEGRIAGSIKIAKGRLRPWATKDLSEAIWAFAAGSPKRLFLVWRNVQQWIEKLGV